MPGWKRSSPLWRCLSYLEGVRRGYTSFRLYGGVGGREDHTFANYSLLLHGKINGHSLTLIGKSMEVFIVRNEKIHIVGEVGDGVSVFAIGGCAYGVSLSGLKYTADGITLTPDFALGVSNEFSEKGAEIGVSDGALLVMIRRS